MIVLWLYIKKTIFAQRLVLEWLDLHREELMSNWVRAQNGVALEKIEPLK